MNNREKPSNPFREIVQPFIDLIKAPRALWGINVSNFLEGLVYFGILTLLAMFLNENIGLNDQQAGWIVGFLTGGITLAMLFLGGCADKWGVKTAIIAALSFMLVGRIIFSGAGIFFTQCGMWSPLFYVTCFGLLLVIIGYGMYQPACYAAVKQFTDEKTATMGYAMLYGVMNLGGFMPALISPPIRKYYGITGVFWVYVFLTLLGLFLVLIILSDKAVKDASKILVCPESETADKKEQSGKENTATESRLEAQRISFFGKLKKCILEHPLADGRFAFFIFILIPVQTLFAHNWLTLPLYVDRAYTGIVKQNMEFFVNINPLLIFILTPIMAAITRRKEVYKMMILGTFIMALPTFFLAIGPNIISLFAYIFMMSIGEAIWQPRFLQYVAEIAPEGKTGAYMGIAQFPWFLTKLLTSLYSGWFLTHYCPKDGRLNTQEMWMIYGIIAMITPVFLLMFSGWVKKGVSASCIKT